MLKVLFSSRTGCADTFVEWATETLFTAQMGTQVSQDALAARLLRVDARAVNQLFRCTIEKTPCLYLIEIIGNARTLLPDVNLADYSGSGNSNDCKLYKYGYTDNLPRRMSEHEAEYRKEFKADVNLVSFAIIDPKFLSEAETRIKYNLRHNSVKYTNRRGQSLVELVVIHKNELVNCTEYFSFIQKSFIGQYADLTETIVRLKGELTALCERHRVEKIEAAAAAAADIAQCNAIASRLQFDLDLTKSHHQTELMKKDNIILQRDRDVERAEQAVARTEMECKCKLLEAQVASYSVRVNGGCDGQ